LPKVHDNREHIWLEALKVIEDHPLQNRQDHRIRVETLGHDQVFFLLFLVFDVLLKELPIDISFPESLPYLIFKLNFFRLVSTVHDLVYKSVVVSILRFRAILVFVVFTKYFLLILGLQQEH
jgi:hypothetical protein